MPRIAANLGSLWAELPFLDRFEAAAAAGFEGVAVPFPYDLPVKETQRALMRAGLSMVQITAPPPNYTGGVRGFAAMPEAQDRFRYDLRRALRYIEALRAPFLHIMAGQASGEAAKHCLIENLRYAAENTPDTVILTLEPRVAESTFLQNLDLASEVLHAVGSPRVRLQLHAGQADAMGHTAHDLLMRYGNSIAHVQTDMLAPQHFEQFLSSVDDHSSAAWVALDVDTGGDTDTALAPLLPILAQHAGS